MNFSIYPHGKIKAPPEKLSDFENAAASNLQISKKIILFKFIPVKGEKVFSNRSMLRTNIEIPFFIILSAK